MSPTEFEDMVYEEGKRTGTSYRFFRDIMPDLDLRICAVDSTQCSASDFLNLSDFDKEFLADFVFVGDRVTKALMKSTPCQHDWKHYVGIMDEFDYCSKCDEKRRERRP